MYRQTMTRHKWELIVVNGKRLKLKLIEVRAPNAH